MQAIQVEVDTIAFLDRMEDSDSSHQAEKPILASAFEKHAFSGWLVKEQLKEVAADLGTERVLTDHEVNEIWKQVSKMMYRNSKVLMR